MKYRDISNGYDLSDDSDHYGKYLNKPTNPNDPVEMRIRRLVDSVNSHDRSSLIYQVPRLVEAAKDPQDTKRNWLVGLYEKKGWVDKEFSQELKKMDAESALSELKEICLKYAELRSAEMPVLRYKLPIAGEKLGDYIREILEHEGINTEELMVRYLIDPKVVGSAIYTGNDRTVPWIGAYNNHHGGYDGEELAMIRHGITDASDTTYLSELNRWIRCGITNQRGEPILVYFPDALEGIGPLGFMYSNGFHAFHFTGDVKQRSLLAVFM
ncbi:MAG: hypothetical protein V1870_05135 [Candidatus Aenigmatarchaeota archaeon]